MSGSDTVRGIAYQQAQAVLVALDSLEDGRFTSIRVEGVDDVVDVETMATDGLVYHAIQIKTRSEPYTWSEAQLVAVLKRWALLSAPAEATFEFLTDGRLGPSGERLSGALERAARGEPELLAELLNESTSSPLCRALSQARIRIDAAGVGVLVARAERQLSSMLPMVRTEQDAREEAKRGVSELFLLLFDRAGRAEPDERIVSRQEIESTLGVDGVAPLAKRWPGTLRDCYLGKVDGSLPPGRIEPKVRRLTGSLSEPGALDGHVDSSAMNPSVLLESRTSILTGQTGTGKSVASEWLCRYSRRASRVVCLAHAEAYIPGRLEALAADAIADRIGEDLPFSTGRQILADSGVTVVVDGVSEIPAVAREALRVELESQTAAGRGASIVLVGRDIAELRAALPTSVAPSTFVMANLDHTRQTDLAGAILPTVSPDEDEPRNHEHAVRVLVAQVQSAIGNGAENPLLFTMAATLLMKGAVFTNRAALFEAFIADMARRTGVAGISEASLALGIVLAGLLNRGQRYADSIEWSRLLTDAVVALKLQEMDHKLVSNALRRSGLVVPTGYAQMPMVFHDSVADYLAGSVHARGLAPFPSRLASGDARRILFAAEISGVDDALGALVARDLPFLSVRLSHHDKRELAQESPREIEELLGHLLPEDESASIAMWRPDDRRVVAIRQSGETPSGWVTESAARNMLESALGVVVDGGGPLNVAVRVWRAVVRGRLGQRTELAPSTPASIDEACSALASHARLTADATRALVKATAPRGLSSELAAAVGPVGLDALVYSPDAGHKGSVWPVFYRDSETVSVVPAVGPPPRSGNTSERLGSTSVVFAIAKQPAEVAADRVRSAIQSLSVEKWL